MIRKTGLLFLLSFAAPLAAMAGDFAATLKSSGDDIMMGLPSCRIDYSVSNQMEVPVRRGSFRVLPILAAGSTLAGAAEAGGEALANTGPVAIGETIEKSFKVRGARCADLKSLELKAFYCVREPDKGNCNAAMTVVSRIESLPLTRAD